MGLYYYKAIDTVGRMISGQLDANNPVDLEQRLQRMGMELIHCRAKKHRTALFQSQSITRRELITFCFHLEQLTRSGVPILEGLADLRDSVENPRFREVLANMVEDIEGGLRLSDAAQRHGKVFDTVFANLLRAGEETGKLSEVLLSLTENLKWQDELNAKTKKIIMYPAFVTVVITAVVFFLMIYLVPQLLTFIKSMNQELPLHTKILLFVSDIFVEYWYLVLAFPLLIVTTIAFLAKISPSIRFKLDELKLNIPVIGPILRKIILARFANFFALMYTAGITILEAMKISEGIAGNLAIQDGLARARAQVADGKTVSASLEGIHLFPPLVIRMVRVGETTGALDTALLNISYFYDRDVKEAIEKAQTLIEPTLTVVLGAILGWVMISVLGPIYDLISKVNF